MQNIVSDEIVKAEIQNGLSQVDPDLMIDEFECAFDTTARKLRVHLTAKNKKTQEKTEINKVWG